jgi:hypothetical protein
MAECPLLAQSGHPTAVPLNEMLAALVSSLLSGAFFPWFSRWLL